MFKFTYLIRNSYLKKFENFKNTALPVFLVVSLLFLSVSGFSKSDIPVITKDSRAAVVKGCHDQVNHSTLKKFVLNIFKLAADENNCCDKVCFCCSKNIRKAQKFISASHEIHNIHLDISLTANTFYLYCSRDFDGVLNNKSPPFILSI